MSARTTWNAGSLVLVILTGMGLAACGGETSGVGVCEPGQRVCAGAEVLECRAGGDGFDTLFSCQGGFTCRDGACVAGGAGPDTLVGRDTQGGTDAPAGPDAVTGSDTATGNDTVTASDTPTMTDTPTATDAPTATDTPATTDTPAATDTPADTGAPADAVDTWNPLCGNGRLDPGETCDPEAPAGTPGECPTECGAPSGCVVRTLEGSAAECSAFCRTSTVTEIGPQDGCCPMNATHDTDSDCPDECGDGELQAGERCDPGITPGNTGVCPTACASGGNCDVWQLQGVAAECSARCVLVTITEVGPVDDCCPIGAAFEDDPDCPNLCGDGVVQPGERCDPGIARGAIGSCPVECSAPEPCRFWTLTGAADECSAHCVETLVTAVGPADGCCPAGAAPADDVDCTPECGNGRVEDGEDCDGGVPTGVTCASLGFASSDRPVCTGDCDLDTFPCGGHAVAYEKVTSVPPVSAARGSYMDAAWFPDGEAAVVMTDGDALLLYDATTGAVSVLADGLLDDLARLATLPDHDAILVLGRDFVGGDPVGRALLLLDAAGNTAPLPALDAPNVTLQAFTLSPDGGEAVVGGYDDDSNITHLYLVETETWTVTKHVAWASYGYLSDVTWAHVPRSDPRFVVTFAGFLGKDSRTWYVDYDDGPQPNNLPGSFGNLGRGAWRPGGRYAIAAGWTSTVGYVYTYLDSVTWSWEDVRGIPGPGTDFRGVYWHPRGHRGLMTGRSGGLPRVGRVVEIIPHGDEFSSDDWREADIPGFTDPPFNADSSANLHAAAWRPGQCDGGLLVGDDDGTSYSPTFGLIIRFWDVDDTDCQ